MLAERIKESRKAKKLSQAELAKALKVSQQTVGSWEVGRSEPNAAMIAQLAEYLTVTSDYLLGLVDQKDANLLVAAHMDDGLTEAQKQDIADYIAFKKQQYLQQKLNNQKG